MWKYAWQTAVYLKNRTPIKRKKYVTPYELLFNRKPNLGHIRMFGAHAYAHIPMRKSPKTMMKADKWFLVGFEADSEIYLLLNTENGEILRRGNVYFDESKVVSRVTNPTEFTTVLKIIHQQFMEQQQSKNIKQPNNVINDATFPKRKRDRPKKMQLNDTAHEVIETKPKNYWDAHSRPTTKEWRHAEAEEIKSLEQHNTWDIVSKPNNRKILTCMWVYAIKTTQEGKLKQRKARLVAHGHKQLQGIDYEATFSPTPTFITIRLLLATGIQYQWFIESLDVSSAYIHAPLSDTIYMTAPPGYNIKKNECLLLKKALYGLKQSGRVWNEFFSEVLQNYNMKQSVYDHCMFVPSDSHMGLIILVYVDDILVFAKTQDILNNCKQYLHTKLLLKEFGVVTEYLNASIVKSQSHVIFSQAKFINHILAKYHHHEANSVEDMSSKQKLPPVELNEAQRLRYQQIVGALMYLSVVSRPDIAFNVNACACQVSCATTTDFQNVHQILRFLKGTVNHSIIFKKTNNICPISLYVDADFANDISTRRSTSGWVIMFNSAPIAWGSCMQKWVALSTVEAELNALVEGI